MSNNKKVTGSGTLKQFADPYLLGGKNNQIGELINPLILSS